MCFSPHVTGEPKNSSIMCYCCLVFQAALKGGIPPLKAALILKLPSEGQLANFASFRAALNLRHQLRHVPSALFTHPSTRISN
jgi:hypothetical protein